MSVLLLIAGRVIASPLVNVLQKRLTRHGLSPELIVMLSYLFFVILSVPAFFIIQPFDLPVEFWYYIVLLGVLDIFGNMFLVKSLKIIDLSVFGPLNSFKPVIALIFSVILLDEVPSIMGISGVMIIVFGSNFLKSQKAGVKSSTWKFLTGKGIMFRFLAILLTSVAAVFSKKAIVLSSPLITLIFWAIIGWPISIFMLRLRNPYWKSELTKISKHTAQIVWLCLTFLSLQLLTLLTFERVFVGYSLAFFQLSSVVSVLFGFHFFKEPYFLYRLAGSAIMVLGAILILFSG